MGKLTKRDYVIKQLSRTRNKRLELYAVTRLVHVLNDLDIKFVTQQYVTRPDRRRALTDLFFPQFDLHIEVDEPHHLSQLEADKLRSADIINATNHRIERVDMHDKLSLDEVNKKIDVIVAEIKTLKEKSVKSNDFLKWDMQEFEPQTYIDKGYIDIKDHVAFRTSKDACNCFGYQYKGFQKGGVIHPHEADCILWFPKLYTNGEWMNSISDDESVITEKNKNNRLESHIDQVIQDNKHKRIVFAHVKDNLGQVLYRFRGKYALDLEQSNYDAGLIWNRISTKVNTYPAISK